MRGSIFFDGMDVLQEDLDELQTSKEFEIKARLTDTFHLWGLAPAGIGSTSVTISAFIVAGTNSNTIKVKALNAYDASGERITIASDLDNLKPDGSGGLANPGTSWQASTHYAITVRYTEVQSAQEAHPDTGELFYTRASDSYTLRAVRRNGGTIDPLVSGTDIHLGRVETDGSGNISAIIVNQNDTNEGFPVTDYLRIRADQVSVQIKTGADRPSSYAASSIHTLHDHITSVGTGTVAPTNPHGTHVDDLSGDVAATTKLYQEETHGNGIHTTSSGPFGAGSLNAIIVSNINPTPDSLTVYNLVTDESAYIDGVRYITAGIMGGVANTSITFAAASSGLYYIIVDTSGTVSKTGTNPSGDSTKLLLFTVTFDSVTGDLSALTDKRPFGTIGTTQINDKAVTPTKLDSALDYTVNNFTANGNMTVEGKLTVVGAIDPNKITVVPASPGSQAFVVRDSANSVDRMSVDEVGNVDIKGQFRSNGNSLLPAGVINAFAGSSTPNLWLLCDGSSVSRTTYADLFSAIGTAYGSADGSHFNLPDLRGRFPLGKVGAAAGNGRVATIGSPNTLGGSGGEETHLLTSSESGLRAHHHGITDLGQLASNATIGVNSTIYYTIGTTNTDDVVAADALSAHNNVPPYLTINYIIFAGV